MKTSPLAGKPATPGMLVDVLTLIAASHADVPDPSVPAQRVVFGTSGHRGSALARTFNEWHVLAISQAVCEYRKQHGIGGPLLPYVIPWNIRSMRGRNFSPSHDQ